MKKRQYLWIAFTIVILLKIGLYQLCKLGDKGLTNYSTTMAQSKSNHFFLANYPIEETTAIAEFKPKEVFGLNSIFAENNWRFECPMIGLAQVPTKVNGYNLVLPMELSELALLENFSFYLTSERDTITLRGNLALSTTYHAMSWDAYKDLSNYELLIKNRKSDLAMKFKLKKEENE